MNKMDLKVGAKLRVPVLFALVGIAAGRTPTSAISKDKIGCWHDGRHLDLYEKVTEDGQWRKCTHTPDGKAARMEPIGCVDVSGNTVRWGGQFEEDGSKYNCRCSLETMECHKSVVGCMENGKFYSAYQLIKNEDGSVWRCMVPVKQRSDRSYRKLAGCSSKTITGRLETKRVNCTWDEGRPPYQYVKQCKPHGDTARIETKACLYKERAEIKPGCFNLIGRATSEAAACESQANGSLEIKVLGSGTRDELMRRGVDAGYKPACWMIIMGEGYEGECC